MDAGQVRGWIEKRGYEVSAGPESSLRVAWSAHFADRKALPPLYVQCTENWVVLSVLPVEYRAGVFAVGLPHALLAYNRKIPFAKFALGDEDEVVLCAELPTESLDEPRADGA